MKYSIYSGRIQLRAEKCLNQRYWAAFGLAHLVGLAHPCGLVAHWPRPV
jgi:hypothetical protein